jgi:mannose-6-phosphate isomerase class I
VKHEADHDSPRAIKSASPDASVILGETDAWQMFGFTPPSDIFSLADLNSEIFKDTYCVRSFAKGKALLSTLRVLCNDAKTSKRSNRKTRVQLLLKGGDEVVSPGSVARDPASRTTSRLSAENNQVVHLMPFWHTSNLVLQCTAYPLRSLLLQPPLEVCSLTNFQVLRHLPRKRFRFARRNSDTGGRVVFKGS